MNDAMIYRPYKTQTAFLFLTIPLGIATFVIACYCLFSAQVGLCLIFTGAEIGSIWVNKVLYDDAKRAVLFDETGLRMIGGSYLDYRCISWEDFPYAYYARSYKGHLFLVLSPGALGHKEAKRFANKGAIYR